VSGRNTERGAGAMQPSAIVLPAIAMFFLTFSMIGLLAYRRLTSVRRGEIPLSYFELYNVGVQPDALQQIGRHVQNHFEVPPLFYIVVLFLYVTGAVTPLTVGLAWAYVALRAVHSVIHLGSNDVNLRFTAFGASCLALTGLWLSLLFALP
jgi:hypothetical protein